MAFSVSDILLTLSDSPPDLPAIRRGRPRQGGKLSEAQFGGVQGLYMATAQGRQDGQLLA